jgi:hypothetical protein
MKKQKMFNKAAALAVAGIIVSGCQATAIKTQPVSKELAVHPVSAQPVGYKRSTKDMDGTVRTVEVVSVENDLYQYKSTDGYEWTNLTNPMLPSPTFSGEDWGTGTQKMTNVKGAMFPLQVGNKMSFTVVGKSDKWPDGWNEVRKCEVESQERVTVVAGDFDAYKVVCKSEKRTRVYFFAPELNDIVWYRNTHKTDSSKTNGWELAEAPGAES